MRPTLNMNKIIVCFFLILAINEKSLLFEECLITYNYKMKNGARISIENNFSHFPIIFYGLLLLVFIA